MTRPALLAVEMGFDVTFDRLGQKLPLNHAD
jgi:hypothetical protein